MINLNKTRALWFLPMIKGKIDWLCTVVREDDGLAIHIRYTVHGPGPDRVGTKQWYVTRPDRNASEESVISIAREMMQLLTDAADEPLTEIIVGDHDMSWFVRELQRHSWARMIVIKPSIQ